MDISSWMVEGHDPRSRHRNSSDPKADELQRVESTPKSHFSQYLRYNGKTILFRARKLALSFSSAFYPSCLQWEPLYFNIVLRINGENICQRQAHSRCLAKHLYIYSIDLLFWEVCSIFLLLGNHRKRSGFKQQPVIFHNLVGWICPATWIFRLTRTLLGLQSSGDF